MRINALRKELIKTEMRIRQKNKFFQDLSLAGDKVFPRRKKLIKEISDAFVIDVDSFVARCQSVDEIDKSLHFFREEIKALQSIAKLLTLNTRSFTTTRTKLSECWDKIKGVEKVRKKERNRRRQFFKENAEEIRKLIREASEAFDQGTLSQGEMNEKLDGISAAMRNTELAHVEVKALKDEFGFLRKRIAEKVDAEEQARLEREKAKEAETREQIQNLKESIEGLIAAKDDYDADRMSAERDRFQEEAGRLLRSKAEKQEFERFFKSIRDIITEKKEQALLAMSADDRETLEQLRNLLQQRKIRRQEVKDHLEQLRKVSGSSGFDFDQAMTNRDLITEEKERLEKADQGILEIEKRILQLEKDFRLKTQE